MRLLCGHYFSINPPFFRFGIDTLHYQGLRGGKFRGFHFAYSLFSEMPQGYRKGRQFLAALRIINPLTRDHARYYKYMDNIYNYKISDNIRKGSKQAARSP